MDTLMFRDSDETFVNENMKKLFEAFPAFNTPYFRKLSDFIFRERSLIDEIICWSPFLRMSIMPNGDVYQCNVNPEYKSVGNLNKSSFIEVWNSAEFIRQREEIRLHKNQCICWTQDTSFNALINSLPLINKMPALNKKDN